MSEKYTIDFDGGSTIINDDNGDVYCVLNNKDGYLVEYARAELVCKLLNENEERNNQPRIDIDIKKDLMALLKNVVLESRTKYNNSQRTMVGYPYVFKERMQNAENAIKILESLEADDGK